MVGGGEEIVECGRIHFEDALVDEEEFEIGWEGFSLVYEGGERWWMGGGEELGEGRDGERMGQEGGREGGEYLHCKEDTASESRVIIKDS